MTCHDLPHEFFVIIAIPSAKQVPSLANTLFLSFKMESFRFYSLFDSLDREIEAICLFALFPNFCLPIEIGTEFLQLISLL